MLVNIYKAESLYNLSSEEEELIRKVILFRTSETAVTIGDFWFRLQDSVLEIPGAERDIRRHVWGLVNFALPNAPRIIDVPEKLIEAIENAGGVAVFAHPKWYPEAVFPKAEFKADTINKFAQALGIGKAKASALYDGGYTSMAQLQKATKAELMNVKGIGPKMADRIIKNLEFLMAKRV